MRAASGAPAGRGDLRQVLIAGVCVAAAYVLAARLGFQVAFVAEQVTTVWAPTGIAQAALLLWGLRLWPAVWLGAFAANAATDAPLWTAAIIATGNTLEAVAATWLLRRVPGFDPGLRRFSDTGRFIVLAGLAATAISASIGVAALCLAGVQPWADFSGLWSAWWLGDALGALVVAPVILTAARSSQSRQNWASVAGVILGGVVLTEVVFGPALGGTFGRGPLHYIIFPVAIIAAVRFGQPATAMLIFASSAVTIWHTVRGGGPFASPDIHQGLIQLQAFMGVLASTGLLLAAAITERETSGRRRAAAQAVGDVLADAPDLERAAPAILRDVCEHLDLQGGALWLVDDDLQQLRCFGLEGGPRTKTAADFGRTTRDSLLPKGIGLPGRVWSAGRPLWVDDVLDAAFAFPIRLGGDVLGVIEFFSDRPATPDHELLETMSTVGNQVGQFIGRKRVETAMLDEQRRTRAILETALDAVIGMDHRGLITDFNPAAERLFGYQKDKAAGRSLADLLIPPDLREAHRQGLSRYLSTGESRFLSRRIETRGQHADGHEFPIELAITRIQDDGAARFTGFVRDLTERVQSERERLQLVQRELDARREGERHVEAVRVSEERFRSLAASTSALTLYEQDLDLRYRWVFPQHPEFPNHNIGKTDVDLLPPGEGQRLSDLKRAVLESGAGRREEITVTLPTETRSYDLIVEPQRDGAGAIIGISGVAVDITERKRTDDLLVEHKNVLELIAMGHPAGECLSFVAGAVSRLTARARACVLMADPERRTFDVSQATQIAPSFADGLEHALGDPDVAARIFRRDATSCPDIEHDDRWTAAWRKLCLSHGIHACHFEPALSADGTVVGTFMLCFDEARAPGRWEIRIAEFGAHIASIVIEREHAQDALRASEERLREADRRKDEFIAMLAHELRNPLAPIRTGLQLVQLAGDTPGAVERIRPMMERQIGHMVRLIDDLLDISRITSGKIHLQRQSASLADLVNGAVDANRAALDAARVQLTVRLPDAAPRLFVDPTRLVQVISNLLNNAAKFTDAGGTVLVAADIVSVGSGRQELVLSVSDNGIGIAGELLPHVFELFTQGPRSTKRSQPGLGIGLALARQILEMHGGRIEASSAGPGRGSEFTVHLPIDAAGELAGDPPVPGVPPEVRRRVLVVDDNTDAAETLAALVRTLGGEARIAGDGRTGIESASSFSPDVILLDIGMPEMDGYETCRRLREQPFGRHAFIVAITGWGQEEDKRRAAEAGFDAHFTKPADPVVLARLLAAATAVDASSRRG